MSQETINKSLQNTLISPLTHDLLWSQFLNSMSYELQNMRDKYSEIRNNWNIDKNDKSNLIRISESFGYTPNLIINSTTSMAKKEIESMPYRIREKTTYLGYNLIFQQNNSLGEVFNYYWNDKKLIKVIDYEKTVANLITSDHYSPFLGIETKKNYSSILNSDVPLLDYTLNGEKQYDDSGLRYYSLDQTIGSSIWGLDTAYVQIPTKHLGIEYFPQNYYCVYTTSLGIAEEETSAYETQIEMSEYYLEKSMIIKINDIILNTSIEVLNNKEYFIDNNGILDSNSYFDVKNNLVHLEFNEIPSNYEISVSYNIDLMMTSDYFYYLEQGMEYNRRCPIIPHSGIFLSVDIASSRGSDFYYPNENNYTVPDLKIKAVTASSYNRYITLTDSSRLDNAWDEQGQPTGEENYKLDSLIKWTLDSKTTEKEGLAKNFKYIAYGNKPLNIINEENNQIFNQNSMIFYYNMNSEDYSSTIYDNSSNQIHCTVVGSDLKIDSIIDKSLNFNGETYAYSNTMLAIDASQDYTLGLWFKASNLTDISSGTIFESFINISYDYINNKLIIDGNEFDCDKNYHFLCLHFNHTSNTVKVYIDCIDYGQFNFAIISSSHKIYLGTNNLTNNNFYGEIDNIWLLGKTLNDVQMSYIFNNKISVISHMGNRLSYYELTDDEIYDDTDNNYLLIQSYVKSMDINNEHTMLTYDASDSANYTYTTKFSPIIPSYFNMSYTDSLGKTVTIKSNEDGKFYNEDTGKNITGGIDFDKGIWNLTKNTIQSISQKPIVEINKKPYKKTYTTLYHVIDESAEDPNDRDCWYSTYDVKTQKHGDKIVADEYDVDGSTKTTPTFIYKSDADKLLTNIYSNDEENFYVYINDEKSNYINLYNVDSDDAETPLFSKDNGKSLYSTLSDLISNTNQLKAYVDLGEASATTIYSKDGGITMYLDVACSNEKQIHKYTTTTNGDKVVFYTLGDSPVGYSNLSFTSIISYETIEGESFNPMQLVIKTVQSDLISTLNLYYDIHEYTNVYTLDYIQNFQVSIELSNIQLVKNSIVFYFWMTEDGVLTKKSASIDAQGGISGDNINTLLSSFDYNTNTLSVTFYNEVNSDIIVSYEYYYSLDIDYSKPIMMNYKIQKSTMVNEIGLEDENHELMAYMTFPNIEFHTIYNNISALFAIAKSS